MLNVGVVAKNEAELVALLFKLTALEMGNVKSCGSNSFRTYNNITYIGITMDALGGSKGCRLDQILVSKELKNIEDNIVVKSLIAGTCVPKDFVFQQI